MRKLRTEQQRQLTRSAYGVFGPRHRRSRVETEFGNAREPFRECYSDYHARQIGADAAMDAEAEGSSSNRLGRQRKAARVTLAAPAVDPLIPADFPG